MFNCAFFYILEQKSSMKIISKMLESQYFADRPPVLLDIGASGEINAKWKQIAAYCVCLAFDADDREFNVTEQTNSAYKKLIIFNRIVTAEPIELTDFYLTSSPYCSSLLEPEQEKLKPWVHSGLFSVVKKVQLRAITLMESLKQANVDYIDWFKTDSQGTDMRLMNSLSPALQDGILAAELEPGIMDAYKEEDKLHSVMSQMKEKGFWMSEMVVKGVQRLNSGYIAGMQSYIDRGIMRTSPGWAEVTYLREMRKDLQPREYLMLIVFALLEQQYGFALEVAEAARAVHPSVTLFGECINEIHAELEAEKRKRKAGLIYLKEKVNRAFARLNV